MINKKTIIDIVICIALSIVILAEIIVGMNMVKNKWNKDTDLIIKQSATFGRNVAIVDTVFSWPEVVYPNEAGDIVVIDENKFRINGTLTDNAQNAKGYVYYADITDKASKFIQYDEVLDTTKVDVFHAGLDKYFSGDPSTLITLLPVNTVEENVSAYQQTFTEGAIPVLFDEGTGEYYMYLDCVTSYYVLHSVDPFIVTDGKVTVHYSDVTSDPLTQHAWSTYEAGAIDNTRAQLNKDAETLDAYTKSDIGNIKTNTATDSSGNTYLNSSSVASNSDLYLTEADNAAREVLVSYGSVEFNEDGSAKDGSTNIDITSTAAKASEWVLTSTQYSYTDYGITINGLSGKRTSSMFEVSGNASNTVSAERPWVLCVKFMGEGNKLLGVKVVDNRSDPIPADGVSYFTVDLDSSDNIDFSQIVAVQFAVR